jgi:hypothetical protein
MGRFCQRKKARETENERVGAQKRNDINTKNVKDFVCHIGRCIIVIQELLSFNFCIFIRFAVIHWNNKNSKIVTIITTKNRTISEFELLCTRNNGIIIIIHNGNIVIYIYVIYDIPL